ncbi:alpha/beta fold hydrolase [Pseudonocardia sp. GCM10023141]|uniref:alpha/beta fold hydrolase n=1 Tax=Pseudonocardia sp. GCM10023141 TaxID=3252653 RepID=UPI00361ABE43
MTLVVLVHGAWHTGSSWAPVVQALAERGRDAVAMDLPGDRPGSGLLDHAAAVEESIAAAIPRDSPERVVLVGHSLGGLTVPVVAQRLGPDRVAAMVLVAALVPEPGRSFREQSRADPHIMAAGFGPGQVRHDDGTTSWPVEVAPATLYRGVAEESSAAEVAAAITGLRPQAWDLHRDVTPLVQWPGIPTTVVVCAGDQVVSADRLRSRAAELPNTQVVELPGGHFPMLTRPAELAAVIESVVEEVSGAATR